MKSGNKLIYSALLAVLLLLPALFSCVHAAGVKSDHAQADEPFISPAAPKNEAYYHFAASRMLYLDNRIPESLAELTLAEQHDPSSAYLKYNLALMYMSTGRMQDALAKLEESIGTDPEFAPSFTLLGKIYASRRTRDREVGRDTEEAVDLDSRRRGVVLFLGIMDTESGITTARSQVQEDNGATRTTKGVLFRASPSRRGITPARRELQEGPRAQPRFASALLELALIYEQQGR
jgi:tetratricopeptide (TPR) repeat protein